MPAERSVLVGNLWTDPLGPLWLIFDQSMDMFDGRAGVWMTMCENPDDQEPRWLPPRRISHGVTLNKPQSFQRASGCCRFHSINVDELIALLATDVAESGKR